ncbi:MAG: hypothetical protein M0Q38_05570 [Bacteroidales bacterium]|nr:hypothetical protein [Bacteroidales bacterium]
MKTEGESSFRKETALPTSQEKAETARFSPMIGKFQEQGSSTVHLKGRQHQGTGKKGKGRP